MNDLVQFSEADWEYIWAPYDRSTYDAVLEKISTNDIVLDIGAGDLRLSREIAKIAQRVYAIEYQGSLIWTSVDRKPLPGNLYVIVGDARLVPFPNGITVGILLMRHCTQFKLYFDKLTMVGAKRLITNARWRMGVEEVNLLAERISYASLQIGWYACSCGAAGFKPAPADLVTEDMLENQNEVFDCPICAE